MFDRFPELETFSPVDDDVGETTSDTPEIIEVTDDIENEEALEEGG